MSWRDWGNPPINSTGFADLNGASTTALAAELDSTQLGTKNLVSGQKLNVQVTWIVSADTNAAWVLETATSTDIANGVDIIRPRTPTLQSAQFVTTHQLFKDYRIRARLLSTNGGACMAYISAEVLT